MTAVLVGVAVAGPLLGVGMLAGGAGGQRAALHGRDAALHAELARIEQAVPAGGERPHAAGLARVDTALGRGDVAAALRAWRDAYVEALDDRGWRAMVDVGEAAIRIADAAGTRRGYDDKARDAYMVALVRARRDGSADGIRRVSEALAVLGHRDTAAAVRRQAARFDPSPWAGAR
jgi:hypothetical protein